MTKRVLFRVVDSLIFRFLLLLIIASMTCYIVESDECSDVFLFLGTKKRIDWTKQINICNENRNHVF